MAVRPMKRIRLYLLRIQERRLLRSIADLDRRPDSLVRRLALKDCEKRLMLVRMERARVEGV